MAAGDHLQIGQSKAAGEGVADAKQDIAPISQEIAQPADRIEQFITPAAKPSAGTAAENGGTNAAARRPGHLTSANAPDVRPAVPPFQQVGQKVGQNGTSPNAQYQLEENAPLKNTELPTNVHRGNSGGTNAAARRPVNRWFRFELDIRKLDDGYTVRIRKRLRWSEMRYSRTLTSYKCPGLTAAMVNQIRAGCFNDRIRIALTNGGLDYETVKNLVSRGGRGSGQRASGLTDTERAFLARLEYSLASGPGRRTNTAGAGHGRRGEHTVSSGDVSDAPDDHFADMPNVH